MISSQKQDGGDGSTNLQAMQMVVNLGIDEKRAREICQEMHLQLKNDYTQEALKIANARVNAFEDRLFPKIEKVEGALGAFADPSFQLLLAEAHKRAASTERSEDYDLLSELLIYRFQIGQNRNVRAGISHAVEIVDQVSDEALVGLTASHAIQRFTPSTGDINIGLDVFNNLFGKIIYRDLPTGNDWLDHLDILNAVRLSAFGNLKKIHQLYPEKLSGYVDVGIDKKSDDYKKAVEIIFKNDLPNDILIDHSLNTDFVRVKVTTKEKINEIYLKYQVLHEGSLLNYDKVNLSDDQIKAIESIYDLYSQDGNLKQSNIDKFMVDKRQNLKTLREWWDSLTTGFNITAVGKVLAHSNAQRCDKNLPAFN